MKLMVDPHHVGRAADNVARELGETALDETALGETAIDSTVLPVYIGAILEGTPCRHRRPVDSF